MRAAVQQHGSAVYVLPTGGGKTVVAGMIAQNVIARGGQIILVVHRRELVEQTLGTLGEAVPSVAIGVEAAGWPSMPWAPLQVGMAQSMVRRAHVRRMKPTVVIFDEAHHARAGTWEKILSWWPGVARLGLTATPERLDGKGLGAHFSSMVLGPSVQELVADGYLAPCRTLTIPTRIDLDGLKANRQGEYGPQIAGRITDDVIADAADAYVRYARGKQTIFFGEDRNHSRRVAERLQSLGIKAAHVDGDDHHSRRRRVMSDFRLGGLEVVCNCDLISEGFDAPGCEVVIMGKRTMSVTRYLQWAGRAMRYMIGKTALVLDLAGNSYELGLPDEPREWSLEEGEEREEKPGGKRKPRQCSKCRTMFYGQRCPQCAFTPPSMPLNEEKVDLVEAKGRLPKKRPARRKELMGELAMAYRQPDVAEAIKEIGRRRGYKPGWAAAIIRAKGVGLEGARDASPNMMGLLSASGAIFYNHKRLNDWLARLDGVVKRGNGYKALCPAHADKNPSLSVKEGDNSEVVLVKCFAGCEYAAVRAAVGLDKGGNPSSSVSLPPRAAKPPPKEYPPRPLPSGPDVTIYHYHRTDGKEAFVVVRRDQPGGGKTFSQRTPVGGGLYAYKSPPGKLPLYRLPTLADADKVIVVEGEKCVHALIQAWPDEAYTTWAGGSESWHKTNWVPLKGKTVTVMADADNDAPPDKPNAPDRPGQAAALGIAKILHDMGCQVRVVIPEPEDGADVADWLEQGAEYAAERIGALLKDYEPPDEPDEPEPAPEDDKTYEQAVVESELAANRHYSVLGINGDLIAVRIGAGRILNRRRESLTQKSTLIAIAPLAWWTKITGGEPLTAKHVDAIGDGLIRIADSKGPVDLANTYGRGAARMDDGTVVYHLGDRLLVNGREEPLGEKWLSEPRIELPPRASAAQRRAVAEAVMAYRWKVPMHGQRMLGWIVASIVGGALEWRPHIMLTAPPTVGKSWLLREIVARIMGPLVRRIADATPAALARLTQHSSLPIRSRRGRAFKAVGRRNTRPNADCQRRGGAAHTGGRRRRRVCAKSTLLSVAICNGYAPAIGRGRLAPYRHIAGARGCRLARRLQGNQGCHDARGRGALRHNPRHAQDSRSHRNVGRGFARHGVGQQRSLGPSRANCRLALVGHQHGRPQPRIRGICIRRRTTRG